MCPRGLNSLERGDVSHLDIEIETITDSPGPKIYPFGDSFHPRGHSCAANVASQRRTASHFVEGRPFKGCCTAGGGRARCRQYCRHPRQDRRAPSRPESRGLGTRESVPTQCDQLGAGASGGHGAWACDVPSANGRKGVARQMLAARPRAGPKCHSLGMAMARTEPAFSACEASPGAFDAVRCPEVCPAQAARPRRWQRSRGRVVMVAKDQIGITARPA